jgi:AbrB family looped-hinge helix DNA binding protein
MKQKRSRSGITRKHTGVHEPVAEYLQGAGPVIVMDATGRMVLPKKIRDQFNAKRFEVRATEDHVELIPIKPLHTLLGALPDIDLEKIYREHDQEVDDEDKE